MLFTRKLRLKECFHDKSIHDMSLVKNKGGFTPKRGRDTYLDCLIYILNKHPMGQKCVQILIKMRERPYKNKKQKQNRNIIIKEADKGSAIVIMDAEFYERKIKEMLHDTTMYKERGNRPKLRQGDHFTDKTTYFKHRINFNG